MRKKYYSTKINVCTAFVLFFLVGIYEIKAQVTVESDTDSLHKKDYSELNSQYDKYFADSILSKKYAEAFLKKAKLDNDVIKQADGYYMIAQIVPHLTSLSYADSIIDITVNKEDFEYPAKAFLFKANRLGANGRYKESMEELVKANLYANKSNNIDQQYRIKYFIALLKNNLGEYNENLEIFKTIKDYYKKKFDANPENKYDYLKSIFALGDSYNNNQIYDSAYYENKKGIALSLKLGDSVLYGNFLLSSGMTHFYREEYQTSLDSISKLKHIYKDRKNELNDVILTVADLYLGKTYYELGRIDESIEYLKTVDSVTFEKENFFADLRPAYELLIKSYREKGDTEKQLYYIDRLLKFDNILNKDFKQLYKKINEEYSTPNLIREKQEIIDSLEKNKKNRIIVIIVLSSLLFLVIFFLVKNNKKKKIYQTRFQELFEKQEKGPSTVEKYENKQPQDIGISDVIVEDILRKLGSFEEKEKFLEPNLTVSILSKELKTNSKYLSKIINSYKNKSFSNYVNDLRIDFVVEKLKLDSKFRKYTIKAIANEIGFNTTEAFSKSFHKRTGIYPSFFLKQLEKKVKNK